MSIIKIDASLNRSEEIAEFMLFLLNEDRAPLPRLSIREIILAKTRPGLNSQILTSSITSRFDEIGIPTGPLAGGESNVMENLVKIVVEEFVKAIQNDLRVDVVTDAGALVSASGANGGGALIAIGATTSPHTGIGIAR